MAEPADSAISALTTVSEMMRETYHDKVPDAFARFTNMNKMFKMSTRRLDGDGINIQTVTRHGYAVRGTRDPQADFGGSRAYGVESYKVTFSETPSSNDFTRYDATARVADYELNAVTRSKERATNFLQRVRDDIDKGFDTVLSVDRQLPSTGARGTISGTPKQGDDRFYADASATPSTNTDLSIVVSGISASAFAPGDIYRAHDGVSFVSQKMMVVDRNGEDNSVRFTPVDSNNRPDRSLDASVWADTYTLYRDQQDQNATIISIGDWFSDPVAGESFFGKDRTHAQNAFLQPIKSGPSSATPLARTHFDTLLIQLQHQDPDIMRPTLVTLPPDLENRLRQDIAQDLMIVMPTNEQAGKQIAKFGFSNVPIFNHPALGKMVMNVDPVAPPNKIRGFRLGDWETLAFAGSEGTRGVRFIPGIAGFWNRLSGATPGGGQSIFWEMNGYSFMCDICLMPRRQWEIKNVTAA